MYALWKTQGTSARPWRADVRFGAVRRGESVVLTIDADSAWNGVVRFDVPRHRTILNLPADWPRINSYPEWFTVEERARYQVRDAVTGRGRILTGTELSNGLSVDVAPGVQRRFVVSPVRGG
jgi:hypothetical protein